MGVLLSERRRMPGDERILENYKNGIKETAFIHACVSSEKVAGYYYKILF